MKKISIVYILLFLIYTTSVCFSDSETIEISKPYTFISGTPAMASEVNANFDQSYSYIQSVLNILCKYHPMEKICLNFYSKSFTNDFGMKFNYIEPGTFNMGSPKDEPGRQEDETQHQVTLTQGFYMQTTEVTQGQWKAIMGSDNPERFNNCGDNCPVKQVSWNDVQDFIQKLNQLEGSNKYFLPTEAQWEYAARSGTIGPFANGGSTKSNCAYDDNINAIGWYCGNSNFRYKPVAQKQPNSWGLYDMHGNFWEWCQDRYGPYETSNVVNPDGFSSGDERVIRGGCQSCGISECRSSNREKFIQNGTLDSIGFRLIFINY